MCGRERNEGLRVALRERTAGRHVTHWEREKGIRSAGGIY